MTPKWTKGPWRVAIGNDGKKRVYGDEGGEVVRALSTIGQRRVPAEERFANRDLIAAAPELYEACEMALGAFENNNAIDWNILANVLKKARGEQ